MAFEGSPAYPLSPAAILAGAPESSGVYALYTSTSWVFIGDSDNMRQALFDHLNTPTECIASHEPLSFSCQGLPAAERLAVRDELIARLRPECNRTEWRARRVRRQRRRGLEPPMRYFLGKSDRRDTSPASCRAALVESRR